MGNLIGSRDAPGAKHAAHASALISVIVGALVMVIMIAFKDVSKAILLEACMCLLTCSICRCMAIFSVTIRMSCCWSAKSCHLSRHFKLQTVLQDRAVVSFADKVFNFLSLPFSFFSETIFINF